MYCYSCDLERDFQLDQLSSSQQLEESRPSHSQITVFQLSSILLVSYRFPCCIITITTIIIIYRLIAISILFYGQKEGLVVWLVSFLFSIHQQHPIFYISSLMKEPARQMSPPKIKYPEIDPADKQQKFKLILTQLQERNTLNDLFIKKFISKVNKKFKHNTGSKFNTSTLETCPEIVDDREETDQSTNLLPSCRRFHTMDDSSPTHTRDLRKSNLIPSSQPLQTDRQASSQQKIFMEKISINEEKLLEEQGHSVISAVKEDVGFKKYLRRIYLRDVIEKRGRQPNMTQNCKLLKQKQKLKLPVQNSKCVNIKSLVFGNITLEDSQQIPIHNQSIMVAKNMNSYEPLTSAKMANIFLPTIARHNGIPVKRQKAKPEKMMKVHTQGTQRTNSRCREHWLSESSYKIGCSFRISTLQLRKHS